MIDDEILLKQLEANDCEELFKLTEKNAEYLVPWFGWASNISLENTKRFIKKSRKKNIKRKGCDLGIYYKNELVGVIALMNYDKKITVEAEIAYWLSKDHGGKGIMTRVCRKVEEYCFTKLNFDTLYILAFAENKASRNIPEKLGFDIVDADMDPT
ncbi:MAG: GNAT family N-acetyltransferase, partial [Rickettsiales bacterium]|nr:GNAT family N-acetyltransferase [Rickettsiales bacterium]